MFQKFVIKISGEALKGKGSELYHDETIDLIIAQCQTLLNQGKQIALVFGGGNIWRGRENDSIAKGAAHEMGMMASLINGLYMVEKFRLFGIHSTVYTPFICGGITEVYNRNKVLHEFEKGHIPIFSAGTGLPFFSTDTICAVRAADLGAHGVIYTKEYRERDKNGDLYSGIYSDDPITNHTATFIPEITYGDMIKSQLGAIDQAAASILLEADIPSTIINVEIENALILGANGKDPAFYGKGTVVYAG